MKERILKIAFVAMSLTLTFLYYVYQRRGRTIQQLHEEAQKQLLAQELLSIKEQAARSEDDHEKALNRYSELKLRHAALLKKLGLSLASVQQGRPYKRDE